MKHIYVLTLTSLPLAICAQGGWIKDSNPLNDAATYTTDYPYVGASFVELNGDHLVDLFVPPTTLFINNGNGTFSEIASLSYSPTLAISGSSSADLDNDGDNDIIVSCVPSRVFFNDGTGYFADSSSQVPAFVNHGSWANAIGDYNEDNKLDFIFTYFNGLHPGSFPSACSFYKQQSVGFNPSQLSLYPITDSLHSYTNPYWSDYDLDGDMDLFIASGPGDGSTALDYCFKNLKIETGNDSLTPMTTELFATDEQDGQCYNFIDYDNDGDLDLCLTNGYGAQTRLYRNDTGTYTGLNTVFTDTTHNIANCWGDYDNDGDMDLIITNSHQPAKYYRNDLFSFVYLPLGFSTTAATNGITNGDYDNDGDLDIFTNGIGFNGNTGSVGLYINDTVAGNRNFVNIHLVGTVSNRSAIGAIVRLKAHINGIDVWQMREVNAQNSFQGQNDLRVHFGLGDATIIDSISIIWPSGTNEIYAGEQVNSFYEMIEGVGSANLNVEINQTKNYFNIYPNPANKFVYINIENEPIDEVAKYELINVRGELIRTGTTTSDCFQVYLDTIPDGIYFIRISTKKSVMVQKLIKHT